MTELTGWTGRVEDGLPLPTARGSGIEEVTTGVTLGGLAGVTMRGLSQALKTGGGGGDTGLSTVTGLLRFVEFALDGLLLDPVIVTPIPASDTAVDGTFPITPGDLLCVLACGVCCLLNLGGLDGWFFLFPI